jgi:hypothetical protein
LLRRKDMAIGIDIDLLDIGEGLDDGGDCLDLLDRRGHLTRLQFMGVLEDVMVMVMACILFSAIEVLFLDRVRE